MSYEESIAALCRDTGWPIEYVLGLSGYWRKVMLGWKPSRRRKMTPEQIHQHNLMVCAQMEQAMKKKPS